MLDKEWDNFIINLTSILSALHYDIAGGCSVVHTPPTPACMFLYIHVQLFIHSRVFYSVASVLHNPQLHVSIHTVINNIHSRVLYGVAGM